ncbi:MAG: phosphatase PAP2 family protein, partial [Acidobacteriota bacterium]|nr:phosphatase PAP2 family protein [Acidobacteriota bacterium]
MDALRRIMAQRDSTGAAQIAYWNAGSPGYRWMQIATQELLKRNTPAPLATRALATVAAWDSKYAYSRPRPSDTDPSIQPSIANPQTPSYPSEHAASAASASAELDYLFPDEADAFTQMAQQAASSRLLAGTEFPSDSAAGLSIGQATAAAVVQYAKSDGSDAVFAGAFPSAPGKWSNANPVQPLAGTWQPWVLTPGSQFRPPPPPVFDSPFMANQLALVKNLARTPAVSFTAWFWQTSFFGPWLDAIHRKIFESRLDSNAPRAARVYALTMFAQHDATIACWDTKYAYLEMRPFMFNPIVTTLFPNPGHPSFPSGHGCASGGTAAVMGYLFPDDGQS